MTSEEAYSLAMTALQAVGRAGERPSDVREAQLRNALDAAQTAVDDLTALDAAQPGQREHQHRGLAQSWAATKAHWESALQGAEADRHGAEPPRKRRAL